MTTDNTAKCMRPEIEVRITEVLQGESQLKLAMLYGSAASGSLRPESDVDIAILLNQPLTAEQKVRLSAKLENVVHRQVDLVDLFALSGTILQQILSKGRVLMQKNPEEFTQLLKRMIYNQADMMPYVSRTLLERQQRFIHG